MVLSKVGTQVLKSIFSLCYRLDGEVQSEDKGGQAGTNESGEEVHLLAE